MDKNAIKKYAIWARRELIERVAQRAAMYGITEKDHGDPEAESVDGRLLSPVEKRQRQALIQKIAEKGYQQVIEEVAYTWFNRFAALRFMEVNGYLPTHIRVFTNDANEFKPQILSEAIHLELEGLNRNRVYELENENKREELFKYLLTVQCNALNEILPGMFQKIEDYTELLLPDNLLRQGSVIEQMITMIPEADWTDQVQIIGWLYQYYNTEPKDKVFADLKKNIKITKENIPAATQLFTPDWIVHYMVENSLGRLWLEGHPNDELKSRWKYYLDEAEQEPEVQAQLDEIRKEYAALKPEEIKVIDPCMGSGHILCVLFDVLVQIYEDYGYSAREAAVSIVENNIWGVDIDDRAAQLAYFAVMMKARQYDRRFFSRKIQPHIFSIIESNNIDSHIIEFSAGNYSELNNAINVLISELHDAKEYGSLLHFSKINFEEILLRISEIQNKTNQSIFSTQNFERLFSFVQIAQVLSQKYNIVVTNPPYMGSSGMGEKLSNYVKAKYPTGKLDLFACFIVKCCDMTKENGFCSMITPQAFMFLASYEKLRDSILSTSIYSSMAHMGYGTFGNDFGTTSFVLCKHKTKGFISSFVQLGYSRDIEVKRATLRAICQGDTQHLYKIEQKKFYDIPGHNTVYWISDRFLSILKNAPKLADVATIRVGMHTGNNEIFVREWFEVAISNIGLNCSSNEESFYRSEKWYPYNKGGGNRRWYGYRTRIVNWQHGGEAIHLFHSLPKDYHGAPVRAKELQFKEGITWSDTGSTGLFAARYSPLGSMFDVKGSSAFTKNEYLYYILGFLNVNISTYILNMFNPTITYQVGNISTLPFLFEKKYADEINKLVKENIRLAKMDYDCQELSWDFDINPIIREFRDNLESSISNSIEKCCIAWERKKNLFFYKLKENETRLNKIFIDIYGLQNELNSDISDDSISMTIEKFNPRSEIRNFISYAVGCILGRYSIDIPGLVYAGNEWDWSKYKTFQPDMDGIIPICDDEYFEDDIVGYFIKFVRVVYGNDLLEENLKFIAENLGGEGSPRDVIRNYFINGFYADHCTTYSVTGSGKRPIYWLFDSGKKNGFKCLIYMHRYQPDTIARIRTDYIHEQQSRYRTAIADLEQRINGASTSERVKLSKQLTKLQDQAEELRVYEEKIHHLADQMIKIDLDDGVKVNYAKFQDVLAPIK